MVTQEQWEALIAFANSLDRTKYMTQEEIEKMEKRDKLKTAAPQLAGLVREKVSGIEYVAWRARAKSVLEKYDV